MSNHRYRLTLMHQRLDEQIRLEMRRRLPDSIRLLRLKKLKLAIKDRLAGMRLLRRPAAHRAEA
ncbi:MAG: DUF465 domain-containing protein [Allosphingosinicella sp.]|uniref:DUF465 domain-containing protein n=1 Tax=Allosphingosinicella sp. TaxID=2823234 RepID=UPI0039536124